MCPATICTSSVKLTYTTEKKISTCSEWKVTCPVGQVTTKVYVPWDKSTCPGHAGTPLCRALCPSVRCEGRQDPTPSTSMAEPSAPSVDTVAAITPEPVVPARKLKRKNAMSRQSGKKHKFPMMSLDAAPTVVAIAHIKDTPPPPKTCYTNHKNWPEPSLDRDCDTIED